jgi:curved DNA-binding protein CbpA
MSEDERRRARKAFVREHHPDRGGDPNAFTEGLARFDAADQAVESTSVGRRRRIRVAGSVTWRVFGWPRHTTRVR